MRDATVSNSIAWSRVLSRMPVALLGLFSMGDAVVHGLLDSKHDLNWDEDQVDANNDLTFGDGAVEDDWRANHTKVFGLTGLPGQ